MDFKVYTGDDLDSSLVCRSTDGYVASQVLRSGSHGGTMNKPPPDNSARDAIEREIMKGRIREEILARDMLERRILEEEVRREIEMERIMEIRKLQMEMRSGLYGTSGMVMPGDRQTTLMPTWLETGIAASLRRGTLQDGAEFAFRERSSSHLLNKKTVAVMSHASVRQESPSNETKTANCILSGAKRKAQGDCLIPKQLGCALCKVISSSEEALKGHLQGKKHKANEALLLSSNNKNSTLQSKQNVSLPLEGASDGAPAKRKHVEGKKQQKLWCGLCRVKCNSPIMMEHHLAGKKHKNSIELKKSINNLKIEAAKTEAAKTEAANTEAAMTVANDPTGNTGTAESIEELETAHQPVAP